MKSHNSLQRHTTNGFTHEKLGANANGIIVRPNLAPMSSNVASISVESKQLQWPNQINRTAVSIPVRSISKLMQSPPSSALRLIPLDMPPFPFAIPPWDDSTLMTLYNKIVDAVFPVFVVIPAAPKRPFNYLPLVLTVIVAYVPANDVKPEVVIPMLQTWLSGGAGKALVTPSAQNYYDELGSIFQSLSDLKMNTSSMSSPFKILPSKSLSFGPQHPRNLSPWFFLEGTNGKELVPQIFDIIKSLSTLLLFGDKISTWPFPHFGSPVPVNPVVIGPPGPAYPSLHGSSSNYIGPESTFPNYLTLNEPSIKHFLTEPGKPDEPTLEPYTNAPNAPNANNLAPAPMRHSISKQKRPVNNYFWPRQEEEGIFPPNEHFTDHIEPGPAAPSHLSSDQHADYHQNSRPPTPVVPSPDQLINKHLKPTRDKSNQHNTGHPGLRFTAMDVHPSDQPTFGHTEPESVEGSKISLLNQPTTDHHELKPTISNAFLPQHYVINDPVPDSDTPNVPFHNLQTKSRVEHNLPLSTQLFVDFPKPSSTSASVFLPNQPVNHHPSSRSAMLKAALPIQPTSGHDEPRSAGDFNIHMPNQLATDRVAGLNTNSLNQPVTNHREPISAAATASLQNRPALSHVESRSETVDARSLNQPAAAFNIFIRSQPVDKHPGSAMPNIALPNQSTSGHTEPGSAGSNNFLLNQPATDHREPSGPNANPLNQPTDYLVPGSATANVFLQNQPAGNHVESGSPTADITLPNQAAAHHFEPRSASFNIFLRRQPAGRHPKFRAPLPDQLTSSHVEAEPAAPSTFLPRQPNTEHPEPRLPGVFLPSQLSSDHHKSEPEKPSTVLLNQSISKQNDPKSIAVIHLPNQFTTDHLEPTPTALLPNQPEYLRSRPARPSAPAPSHAITGHVNARPEAANAFINYPRPEHILSNVVPPNKPIAPIARILKPRSAAPNAFQSNQLLIDYSKLALPNAHPPSQSAVAQGSAAPNVSSPNQSQTDFAYRPGSVDVLRSNQAITSNLWLGPTNPNVSPLYQPLSSPFGPGPIIPNIYPTDFDLFGLGSMMPGLAPSASFIHSFGHLPLILGLNDNLRPGSAIHGIFPQINPTVDHARFGPLISNFFPFNQPIFSHGGPISITPNALTPGEPTINQFKPETVMPGIFSINEHNINSFWPRPILPNIFQPGLTIDSYFGPGPVQEHPLTLSPAFTDYFGLGATTYNYFPSNEPVISRFGAGSILPNALPPYTINPYLWTKPMTQDIAPLNRLINEYGAGPMILDILPPISDGNYAFARGVHIVTDSQ